MSDKEMAHDLYDSGHPSWTQPRCAVCHHWVSDKHAAAMKESGKSLRCPACQALLDRIMAGTLSDDPSDV